MEAPRRTSPGVCWERRGDVPKKIPELCPEGQEVLG